MVLDAISAGIGLLVLGGATFLIAFLFEKGNEFVLNLMKFIRKIFMFFAFACFQLERALGLQARESTVSVQLTVPDGGWKIRIDRVYQTPTHLLAVSKLERSQGLAIQVISQAKDSVKVKAPEILQCDISSLGKLGIGPTKRPYSFSF